MKIRCFTEENMVKLYLSPYIEVACGRDQISFRNTIFMEPLTIPVKNDQQKAFLTLLEEGITIPLCVQKLEYFLVEKETDGIQKENADRRQGEWLHAAAEWTLKQMMIRGILE